MSRTRLTLPVGLFLLGPASIGIAAPPDNQVSFDQVMSKWTIAPDGTWTVDAEVTLHPPKVNPSHVVRIPLTWSTSTEKLQVVEARIDKPDGQSIAIGKEFIRDDPPTGDRQFHEFSDQDRLVITIPDARSEDLLVIRTHRDVFKPRVPGGFMTAPVLDRSVGWEETNYTISVPSGMPFHVEMHDFDEQSEVIRNRVMHYLHAPKVVAPAHEVAVLGGFDRLPRFAASTFRDWDEFAKAYASVLLPHAKVTPAVAALAARLTEQIQDPRDQARALYNWVRDNIQVIPLPLEDTRPDPHDAEQVMANRYGDCKDHVVLLYALLAARHIPAEIVLLNASDTATIADPPNIRPMDHLILFLPGLRVYADSTVDVAPFGELPFSELGKPAIHLGGSVPARDDIPMPASGNTFSDMKTDMTLDADGRAYGTTTTTARGAFGIWLRGVVKAHAESTAGAAAAVLREHGTAGTGSFTFDPPTSPGDDYTVRGSFELTNQAALLRGGFFELWTGLRILPRPGDVLGGPMFMRDLRKTTPTFCYPGLQTEKLSLTIPKGRALGSTPPDVKIDTDEISYRSHWTFDGERVTVTREFESHVPGPVCEGARREDVADAIAKVRADLVNPLGIRQDQLPAQSGTGSDDATTK